MASATENRYINVYVNGKQVGNTAKEMSAAYRKLNNDLANTVRGSKEYNDKLKELQKLSKHLDAHRTAIKGVSDSWSQAKTMITAVVGGNLITAGLQKIAGFIPGLVQGAGEMSDAYADVAKTTNLSTSQVESLSKSLMKIDTRTSKKELLDMAVVAGQIGIEGELGIENFVKASDKLTVALGDEFAGGAEEITDVMGRLRNVLGDIKTKDVGLDMLHLGNAINELSASGSATAPVVADFANRIGGVGSTLGVTSGQILGLSATMQELNISTERGGTAMSKIFLKMTTDTRQFYEVAKASMDPKKNSYQDFVNMVNTDLYGAFKKVLEGSKMGGSSATALAGVIQGLELEGAGAAEVFSKMGGAIEMMDGKVKLASESLQGTTSIMDEFGTKNENFAAEIDKLGKEWDSLWDSEAATSFSKDVVSALSSVVHWLKENADTIIVLIKVAAKAAIVYGVWKGAILLQNMAFGKTISLLNIKNGLFRLYIKSMNVASGKTNVFTAAMNGMKSGLSSIGAGFKSLGTSLAANPIAAVTTALYGLYEMYQMVNAESIKHQETLDALDDIEKTHKENFAAEQVEMEMAFTKLRSMNVANEERGRLIDEINSKYGTTLQNLDDEAAFIGQIDSQYKGLMKSMEKKMEMEILMEKLKEVKKKTFNKADDIKALDANINRWKGGSTASTLISYTGGVDIYAAEEERARMAKKNYMDLIALGEEYQKKIEEITASDMKAAEKEKMINSLITASAEQYRNKGNFTAPKEKEKKEKKEKEIDYKIDEAKELSQKLADIERGFTDAILTEDQKQIISTIEKYDAEVRKAQDSIDTLLDEAAKGDKKAIEQIGYFTELQIGFEEAKQREMLAMQMETLEKARKAKEEADKKYNEDRKEAIEKINAEFIDEKDREIESTKKHYAELLELAKKYNIDTTKLEKQRDKIIKKLERKQRQEKIDAMVGEFETYYNLLQGVMNSVRDRQQQLADELLQQISEGRDRDLASLEDAKEKGMITEEEYNAKVEGVNAQARHREAAIKKEAWIKERNARVLDSIINTAVAVTRNLYNPVLAVATGIAGAIQTGIIAGQQVPEFARGGRLYGPSHSRGGLSIVGPDGIKQAEAEGGEVLLSKETVRNNAGIVDRLLYNSQNERGRKLNMAGMIGNQPQFNFNRASDNIKMAKGGRIGSPGKSSSGKTNDALLKAVVNMGNEICEMNKRISNWKTNLKAVQYYRDNEKFADGLNRVKYYATIGKKKGSA